MEGRSTVMKVEQGFGETSAACGGPSLHAALSAVEDTRGALDGSAGSGVRAEGVLRPSAMGRWWAGVARSTGVSSGAESAAPQAALGEARVCLGPSDRAKSQTRCDSHGAAIGRSAQGMGLATLQLAAGSQEHCNVRALVAVARSTAERMASSVSLWLSLCTRRVMLPLARTRWPDKARPSRRPSAGLPLAWVGHFSVCGARLSIAVAADWRLVAGAGSRRKAAGHVHRAQRQRKQMQMALSEFVIGRLRFTCQAREQWCNTPPPAIRMSAAGRNLGACRRQPLEVRAESTTAPLRPRAVHVLQPGASWVARSLGWWRLPVCCSKHSVSAGAPARARPAALTHRDSRRAGPRQRAIPHSLIPSTPTHSIRRTCSLLACADLPRPPAQVQNDTCANTSGPAQPDSCTSTRTRTLLKTTLSRTPGTELSARHTTPAARALSRSHHRPLHSLQPAACRQTTSHSTTSDPYTSKPNKARLQPAVSPRATPDALSNQTTRQCPR
ncbi:hypothetical protein PSPO01_03029 [Paraphaeosphaeria sporulosa]